MLLNPPAAQAQNRLIAMLPPAERKRLLERWEREINSAAK